MIMSLDIPKRIATQRLTLVPLEEKDSVRLYHLWSRPGLVQLFSGSTISLEETRARLKESSTSLPQDGYGLWGIYLNGQLIGFTGFWQFDRPPKHQLVIGIDPVLRGRGFGAEAARTMILYAFEHIDQDEIVASAEARNKPSLTVMEKIGMKYLKRICQDGSDTIYYSISRNREKMAG